jgi:hypothetical protein
VVAQLIADSVAKWGNGLVEAAVFGTAEPAAIADAVGRFCEQELGAPFRDGLFYAASVGCVVGVRLADDSEVVIKAYQPRWTPAFLSSVRAVQAHLADAGFPCPRPIAGPLTLGTARCLVETFLPDPGPVVIEPGMLGTSARALAAQIRLCASLDGAGLRAHPLNTGGTGLYPEPHSPLFDFVLAYASRCEHAIDPDSKVHIRARPRLAADGAALFALAELLD